MSNTAYIHEASTGRWHISSASMNYLNEGGYGYKSRREAIQSIRERGDYTHYLSPSNKRVSL